mgnify:CR=1 FL=1
MNLSPLSRAGLRAGTCALAHSLTLPLAAKETATAQPQPEPAAQPEQEDPDSASDTSPLVIACAEALFSPEAWASAGRSRLN